MSAKGFAVTGNEPNDAYCERLADLAFPVKARVATKEASKAYTEDELRAELLKHPDWVEPLAKRYFLGSGKTADAMLRAAFPLKLEALGKTYYRAKLRSGDKTDDLVEALKANPKLQKLVAVRTQYVPSKWLLEQEMLAREDWSDSEAEDIYTTVARKGLTGVCFSGGGIRSATFNLGVIQGLAQLGLLPHVDYLSSVSGGGYIHEFLAAWILRHRRQLDGVVEELVPQAEPGCLPRSPEPVKWLQRYASYLTPARGLFSTDTWTMLAIWARNTILNQIPIVATLSFVFLAVHLLIPATAGGRAQYADLTGVVPWLMWGTEALLAGVAVWSLAQLGINLERQRQMRSTGDGATKKLLNNTAVQWKLIAPWLAFSVWMSYWVQMGAVKHPGWYWIGPWVFGIWVLAVALVVIFAGGAMGAWNALHPYPHKNGRELAARLGKRVKARRFLFRRNRQLPRRREKLAGWVKNLADLERQRDGKENEIASLTKRIAREKAKIVRDEGRLPKSRAFAAGIEAGLLAEMRQWATWATHWTFAAFCFALAGLLATGIACAMGYGCVLAAGPATLALSRGAGSLDRAHEVAKQVLQFSVSGSGEHFTAMLAGTFSGVKDGLTGMLIDPWRLQLAVLPGFLLGVPYIAIELTLGLLGRDYGDMRREWLARLRAWSLLYALLWFGVVSVALAGPYLGYWLMSRPVAKWSAAVAFLVAHGGMILAGWSGKADGKPTDHGILGIKPMDLLALLALPVSVAGILLTVSFSASWLLDGLAQYVHGLSRILYLRDSSIVRPAELIQEMALLPTRWQFWLADAMCIATAFVVGSLFGCRVDVNEFSMQSFYRNRLSRCYLAATVRNRQPDPFTGFDERVDMPGVNNPRARRSPPSVTELLPDKFNKSEKREGTYEGPFPIFCTTLNLTTGEDLATQERKGTSFAFTPLYSGYSVSWTDGQVEDHVSYNGYVPTKDYAYPMGGIHLDTAVAISGAAANPNMGYNSNPALAFLMTFFNVRLGWWITNTRKMDTWQSANGRVTPKFALGYLLKELFGMVNDSSPFVNLSDGGHFENMGLYELVRRRCRFIVVCDAENDPEIMFCGMGGAITKCRSDFGAEIDLDLRPLRIDEKTGYSRAHCVVGTITYPPPLEDRTLEDLTIDDGKNEDANAATGCECLEEDCLKGQDGDKYTGVLVYMKSTLVGDEPPDLLAYQLTHPVFPQDSTANQWFTETQFEAYRRLGHHVTMTAIQPALSPKKAKFDTKDTIKALFQRMYAIWYPRTPEMEKHLGDHLKQYEGILAELRGRKELAGLEALLSDPKPGKDERTWIGMHMPKDELAYAMQFANSVLDFMATVYLNLELAFPDNRVSPHAEWWICLFRRWCRVDLMKESWNKHAASYPLEFRLFARRELGLPVVAGIRE